MPKKVQRSRSGAMGMRCMSVSVNVHVTRLLRVLNPSLSAVIEAGAPVIRRRKGINHQSQDRRRHRHEPRERKRPPRLLVETWRRQALESVGKHVDEPGRQYHAGGERLYNEKHALLGSQGRNSLTQYRNTYADCAGYEYGSDGGKFVLQRLVLVALSVVGVARAVSQN